MANRIQKLVESGNVKLGQVATDALGVSGLQMLRVLAAGETNPDNMSSMARGRLKRKQKELKRALSGQLTEAQRWVLSQLLDQYDRVKEVIAKVEQKIREEVTAAPDLFFQKQ